MFNILKNTKGVTLLELIVAIALFTFTIVASTQIFKTVIDGQRDAIASQDMQESIRYTFERISKEIRMAKKDITGACTFVANKVYYVSASENELTFLNYKDECIRYFLENGRLKVEWDPSGPTVASEVYITPQKILVNELVFKVVDDIDNKQSKVTIMLDIEVDTDIKKHKQNLRMQTSISSRHYQ